MIQNNPQNVTVTIPLDNNRSYDIHIGAEILDNGGIHACTITPLDYILVLVDENADNAGHYDILATSLQSVGITPRKYVVPSGEKSKSFSIYTDIMDRILTGGIERKTALIAMGGGVVGDLGGFIASSLLRGIPFMQIPTTLLSQVDSAVGGKTGINASAGKNLVGAFYQPSVVLIDICTLDSLPARHMSSGYAEIVKYGCIMNKDFFTWLSQNGHKVVNRDANALIYAIRTSCQCKSDIVAKDEYENAARALLNLGHTFGHALENATKYSTALLHGEAVSIGMIMAYKTAVHMGLSTQSDLNQVVKTLRLGRLKTNLGQVDFTFESDMLTRIMYKDKKVSQGKIRFIIPKGIGNAIVTDTVDMAYIQNLWQTEIGKDTKG